MNQFIALVRAEITDLRLDDEYRTAESLERSLELYLVATGDERRQMEHDIISRFLPHLDQRCQTPAVPIGVAYGLPRYP